MLILIEQLDLNAVVARSVEQRLVEYPGIGVDPVLARDPIYIL